jgi:hypothetical protein
MFRAINHLEINEGGKHGLVAKKLPLMPPSGKIKKASASELA